MKHKSNLLQFLTLMMALPAYADSELCNKFADAFDHANKNLAMTYANGLSDNSPPRATNRYLEDIGDYLKQLILIQQMKAYDCDLPTTISGVGTYFSDAVDCISAQTKAEYESNACDLSAWKGSN